MLIAIALPISRAHVRPDPIIWPDVLVSTGTPQTRLSRRTSAPTPSALWAMMSVAGEVGETPFDTLTVGQPTGFA
jgi:hypothetical protein